MSEVTRPPNSLASRLSAKPRRPAKAVQPPSEDPNEAISPDRMEIHESSAGTRDRSKESPERSRSTSLTLEDEEVVRKAELEECMTLHEEGMGASRPEEATANRDNEEEDDDDDDEEEEDEKEKKTERRSSSDRGRKREKVWEGAPEFQWRRVESKEESCQLIMDNLALSDLNSPFLYQTLCRAKNIQLSFSNSTRDGSFEHSIFRQGRVTARFHSDTQAMAQAVNGLVFLRTPPNRPRLKVLLPQTSQTDSMSGLLEMKLGRVLEPHLKSRQLLVRDVDPESGVDLLREVAARAERLEKAELVTDVVGRRCGLLTYQTPADAIQAHLAADSIPAGTHNRHRRRRYVKVFFMEDVAEGQYVLKPELRWMSYKREAETRSRRDSKAMRSSPNRSPPPPAKRPRPRYASPDRPRYSSPPPLKYPSPPQRGYRKDYSAPESREPRSYTGGGGPYREESSSATSASSYNAYRSGGSYRGGESSTRGGGSFRGRGGGVYTEKSYHHQSRSHYAPPPPPPRYTQGNHRREDGGDERLRSRSDVPQGKDGISEAMREQQEQLMQAKELLSQQGQMIAQLTQRISNDTTRPPPPPPGPPPPQSRQYAYTASSASSSSRGGSFHSSSHPTSHRGRGYYRR